MMLSFSQPVMPSRKGHSRESYLINDSAIWNRHLRLYNMPSSMSGIEIL